MVAWLSSISWPDWPISLVQEQMDQVFSVEETFAIDTANNAQLTLHFPRSAKAHLQWVTRLNMVSQRIHTHLKTVEGRTLVAFDQLWPIWSRFQPDDKLLQPTRVLQVVVDHVAKHWVHIGLCLFLSTCCELTTMDWPRPPHGSCPRWWC